jgi:hypothetical protein
MEKCHEISKKFKNKIENIWNLSKEIELKNSSEKNIWFVSKKEIWAVET